MCWKIQLHKNISRCIIKCGKIYMWHIKFSKKNTKHRHLINRVLNFVAKCVIKEFLLVSTCIRIPSYLINSYCWCCLFSTIFYDALTNVNNVKNACPLPFVSTYVSVWMNKIKNLFNMDNENSIIKKCKLKWT